MKWLIIHHRNLLRHYRTTIREFREMNNPIMIDIDFSEKLKITNKAQAQSEYWNEKSITVHSGILKHGGVKCYQCYKCVFV